MAEESEQITEITPQSRQSYPDIKRWYKVVFAGDPGVGKTSLLLRFIKDIFREQAPTIGGDANAFPKVITLENGAKVGLELWDTVGLERHHSVTDNYYRNADAVLFCYAIDEKMSFEDISEWWRDVHSRLGDTFNDDIVKFLVGTKKDLYSANSDDQVGQEKVEKEREKRKVAAFIETSSKENININELFEMVAQEVHKRGSSREPTIRVDFITSTTSSQKKKSCCN